MGRGVLPPNILDRYNLKARVAPALLAMFPALALGFVFLHPNFTMTRGLAVIFLSCGGALLLAQVGRDLGKRKEPQLFAEWGGAPTTHLLRHRDAANPILVETYHRQLRQLFPALELPTAEEEIQDPGQADLIYDTAVRRLREKTRDRSRFPLVFEENCNYGFRRNLWGMRPIGLGLALCATSLTGGYLAVETLAHSQRIAVAEWASLAVAGLWSLLWWRLVTSEWVESVARTYAERLLGAMECLLESTNTQGRGDDS